jgi:hypothetical protein
VARHFRLWEHAQVINLLPAAADAAGRTSTIYANIKYGHKAFLVCGVNQGNAATVLFTPLQASSTGGTGSKALTNPAPIAYCADTSLASGSDQFTVPGTVGGNNPVIDGVTVAAAANFTTGVAVKNKVVIFEIDPAEVMDLVTNAGTSTAFSYIGVSTGASNAANITSAYLIITPLRDARQNPPTTYA